MNSIYIQLSKYLLFEYIYEEEIINTSSAKTFLLENNYLKEYQFLNNSLCVNSTGNVLDRTVSQMGFNKNVWAYHDIDTPIPILNRDNLFKLYDKTSIIQPLLAYDRVKIHVVSGYNFEEIDGFILDVKWQTNKQNKVPEWDFSVLSVAYLKTENINFNSRPIYVNGRFYDRFVEYKIPSLSSILSSQELNGFPNNSFQKIYTPNGEGFVRDSQIQIRIFEIDKIENINSNQYFISGQLNVGYITPRDEYYYVGCVVKENPQYDFIEYYPTFKGGFIEDYISSLNNKGDWVVINQLEVFEQAGTNQIKTYSGTFLQESGFAEPQLFRPIIRNAAFAVSFTVEYTMRLLNRANNFEIVRKSSTTIFNPKKYGYNLEKINVLENFSPIKVYNKIVNNNVQGFGLQPQLPIREKLVLQTINMNDIFLDKDLTKNIEISPFDNIIYFRLFKKVNENKVPLDLSSSINEIKLWIKLDNDEFFIKTLERGNPTLGEIYFKINESISRRIYSKETLEFWIIIKNEESTTPILKGNFLKI